MKPVKLPPPPGYRPDDAKGKPSFALNERWEAEAETVFTPDVGPALCEFGRNLAIIFDPRTKGTERQRYAHALGAVVQFLGRIGAEQIYLNRFIELAGALRSLEDGHQADFLKPAKVNNRKSDLPAVWGERARICVGLELLRGFVMSIEEAAKHIARKYRYLRKLTTGDLAGAIVSWHQKFERGTAGNRVANGAYRRSVADMRAYIETVEREAGPEAARKVVHCWLTEPRPSPDKSPPS